MTNYSALDEKEKELCESSSDTSSEVSFSSDEVDNITIEESTQQEGSSDADEVMKNNREAYEVSDVDDSKLMHPKHKPSRQIDLQNLFTEEETPVNSGEGRLRSKSSNYELVLGNLRDTRKDHSSPKKKVARRMTEDSKEL